jgi:hypothetical protein
MLAIQGTGLIVAGLALAAVGFGGKYLTRHSALITQQLKNLPASVSSSNAASESRRRVLLIHH